ncbi:hypothetical protein JX266_003053 [Neoarthrinium moseri]|uniref:uncharacterized protein n=1 Tax=Neoarthrinium moseri TaxID=1658444 RepID=UPI001FDCB0AD|nr:uncharacterized protein JN550_011225 [Neoarthrinium moseri]KAI1851591.1 hypothetical protein JX266_003053 [Neoarthrinium moseri]KAI1860910.1 hypothetical protein JN550_011225 [Neoarthrinium moseri]
MPLQTIVVGGGICGLSTAIALRRAGHHVIVYERYSSEADAGAGITIRANAARILERWGLDLTSYGALPCTNRLLLDGKSLRIYMESDVAQQEGERGGLQINATRSDLHQLLRREVERPTTGEGTIKVLYDKHIVDYDAERPAVQLAGGTWKEADLVIACDGIKSKAATIIIGKELPAKPTGFSAFRLLLPDAKIREVAQKFPNDHFIKSRFEKSTGEVWIATEPPDRVLAWWCCRFDSMHAFDIVIPDHESYASSEEWLARCDKSILLEEFRHWHPLFGEILSKVEEPLLWKICDRPPIESVYRGLLCMLGDALHPMGPYRGQGGSQAMEDAAVVEMCLRGVTDRAQVPRRLELLQSLRVPRYACSQMASTVRQNEPNMEEHYQQVLDEAGKWFQGQDQSHLSDRNTFEIWMDKYDAAGEASKALERIAATDYARTCVSSSKI